MKQKPKQYGQNLIDSYITLFHRKVKRQPNFGKLTLHILIGQLPSIKKMRIHFGDNELDLRISGCLFKPSGSGGGRGMEFLFQVMESLNINTQIVTDIRPDSLTGTSEMVKEYDPKRKGEYKVVKVIRGALDPTPEKDRKIIDVLIMNEADVLFDSKTIKDTKDSMLCFQIALNPMGTTDNKIGTTLPNGQWLEFNPECSLLFISYPPDNLYDTMVKRGFLQRMIVIFNMISMDDRIEISKELTGMLESAVTKESEYNDFVKRLSHVNEYWTDKKLSVKINPEAMDCLGNLVDEIFNRLDGINEKTRKSLEEFTQRWIEHTWKIAWHHMILRLDNHLTLEDVKYARGYMLPIWNQLIGLFEAGFTPFLLDVIEMYKSICNRDGVNVGNRIFQNELIDRMAKKMGISEKLAMNKINELALDGWFKQSERGHNAMISLSRMPKMYDETEEK